MRYPIASEHVECTGPVEEAVRAFGFQSGKEIGLDEEEAVTGDEREHHVMPAAGTVAAERVEGISIPKLCMIILLFIRTLRSIP